MPNPLTYGFSVTFPEEFKNDVRWAVSEWAAMWSGHPQFEFTTVTPWLLLDYQPSGTCGCYAFADLPWMASQDQHNIGYVRTRCQPGCKILINQLERWHYGISDPPTTPDGLGEYARDLRSALMHELGHAIGMGHSRASRDPNHDPYSYLGNSDSDPLMDTSGLALATKARTPTKDDCGADLFTTMPPSPSYSNGAMNCNRWMGIAEPPVGADVPDAKYFWIKGEDAGSDGLYNNAFGGLTSQLHQRLKSASSQSFGDFGLFYDVAGPGTYADVANCECPAINPLRHTGSPTVPQFKLRASIGTPDSNTANVPFQLCMYMRYDVAGSSQPYYPGRACSEVKNVGAGTSYAWYESPWYTLPDTVLDSWLLRTYVLVGNNQWLAVGDYEIIRNYQSIE